MCVLFIPRLKKPRLCWLLVLEHYRDRNRARTRLAGVLSLGGFTAEFGHRSSTSTSTISADKGEDEGEDEGEDD
jgi:hypothetical protein